VIGVVVTKKPEEDALKLSLEGENKREGDGFRSISSSMEQTTSQANWIATLSRY
jgi:hypothetical protein